MVFKKRVYKLAPNVVNKFSTMDLMLIICYLRKSISKYSRILTCIFPIFLTSCGLFQPKAEQAGDVVQPPPHPLAETTNIETTTTADAVVAEPDPVEPAPLTNLWDRIRLGYQLPDMTNNRIQAQLNWYARHPDYMARVSKRGAPYLYHIVQEIESRGMPLEIALLPIVESAFDPFAYSHGRASGIWQIVPRTGKYLGLKQNWWYDGRRDIVASTNASLSYLQRLHKRFDNDWLLALAAYNGGQGNVAKAIRKNKKAGRPTDYWNLKLSRETSAYVPKLIALSQLVFDPSKHNLNLPVTDNKPYFVEVDTQSQIDLAQAADLAGLSMDELYKLNPAFNRWATDPGGPHTLLIPEHLGASFAEQLSSIPKSERVTWKRYKIRPGDTLSVIAAKHNTNSTSLREINHLRGNKIRAGDTLMVPIASKSSGHYTHSSSQRLAKRQQRSGKNTQGQKITYTVKSGDSLWAIGKNHGVSARTIAKWNNMAPRDPIKPGQSLVLWTKSPSLNLASANSVIRKLSYRVRKGDSLHRIADRFRIQVSDILTWNHLKMSSYLQPGQSLTLYVDVTRSN